MRKTRSFDPLARRSRVTLIGLVVLFGAFSLFAYVTSRRAAERSAHRATLVRVIDRQRTLIAQYTEGVVLAKTGAKATPSVTGSTLETSAHVLLNGGVAPAVDGDDDDVLVAAQHGTVVRAQLLQDELLINDLIAAGHAALAPAGHPFPTTETAGEHLPALDPVTRVRVLGGLASNVALNASRTSANTVDADITHLEDVQAVLAALSALVAALVGWALFATTRRRNAHFQTLVTSSTDLVVVFSRGRCTYVGESVARALGAPAQTIQDAFLDFIHPDDRELFEAASTRANPSTCVVRVRTAQGDWRHIDARVTDLRHDKHVRGIVINARDVTERVQLEAELTHQAFHDGLTGLANRALLHDHVCQAFARSSRSKEPFAVLLFDLDGFKHVNDSLGHGAGDELLRYAGECLRRVSRESDTLARLGGDEFALLIEGANQVAAVNAAERLLNELSVPATVGNRSIALNASIGIVVYEEGAHDAEELLRHADVAMYAAKEAGRGRYEIFHAEMARGLGEVLEFEQDLRQALRRDEFVVHYQPTIDINTGAITGAEALVRWQSTRRGLVPPDRFIPIAESSGLILEIGEFVLRTACVQAARWQRAGLLPDDFAVWVNISGRQLATGDLPSVVTRALEAAQLAPAHLGLEITENAIIDDGPAGGRARKQLAELHQTGVRFALDDFGTGFSSLAQLNRLPIDIIKVDRSFIADIERDDKSTAITANVTNLAHALGLVAVAEGIETERQLEKVRELGCDVAQGFLLARPAPATDVTAYFEQRRAAGFDVGKRTA